VEDCRLPWSAVFKTACCRVNLDENLVLTSASVRKDGR